MFLFAIERRKKNKNEYKHDKKVIPIRSEVLQLMLTDNKNAEYESIEKLLELLGSQTFNRSIWVVTLF